MEVAWCGYILIKHDKTINWISTSIYSVTTKGNIYSDMIVLKCVTPKTDPNT